MLHPARRPLADTLGLVRLLFTDELNHERRQELERVGTSLGHALELAAHDGNPDSLGWRAVAGHCEAAFKVLEGMVWSEDVRGLIAAARRRVDKAVRASEELAVKVRAHEQPSREEERAARDRRG